MKCYRATGDKCEIMTHDSVMPISYCILLKNTTCAYTSHHKFAAQEIEAREQLSLRAFILQSSQFCFGRDAIWRLMIECGREIIVYFSLDFFIILFLRSLI